MFPCTASISLSIDNGAVMCYISAELYLTAPPYPGSRVRLRILPEDCLSLVISDVDHFIDKDQKENFLSITTSTLHLDAEDFTPIHDGLEAFFGAKLQNSDIIVEEWYHEALEIYKDKENKKHKMVVERLAAKQVEPTSSNFMKHYCELGFHALTDLPHEGLLDDVGEPDRVDLVASPIEDGHADLGRDTGEDA